MPLPAAAALTPLILPALKEVKEQIKHPVIGYSKTVEKQTKKKRVTKTYKMELRAWEIGAGALGIGAVLSAAWMARIWRWKEYQFTNYDGKVVKYHLPSANMSSSTDIFGQITQDGVQETANQYIIDLIGKLIGGKLNPLEGWSGP